MDDLVMTALFRDCSDAGRAFGELLARGHCRESIAVLMTEELSRSYRDEARRRSGGLPEIQVADRLDRVRLCRGDGIPDEVRRSYESGLRAGGIVLGFRPRAVTEADEVARVWQNYRGDFIYY